MQTFFFVKSLSVLQKDLYVHLNQSNRICARMYSVPVALVDVLCETLKQPLAAIECLAMAAINLIAAAFDRRFTLKEVLANTEIGLSSAISTFVSLGMAPFKFIFQTCAIIIDPQRVQSINYMRPTYHSPRPVFVV